MATIPQRRPRTRHLSAVPPAGGPPAVPAATAPVATRSELPALTRPAALRLDQAELFLLSLENEMLTADGLRAAYLLGLAEVHLAGLIELVRAVTA